MKQLQMEFATEGNGSALIDVMGKEKTKIDKRTTAAKIQKAGNASGQSKLGFAKRQPETASAFQQAPSGGKKRAAESAEAEPSSKKQASTLGSSKQQSILIDSDDSEEENIANCFGKGVDKGKGCAVDAADNAHPASKHIDGLETIEISLEEEDNISEEEGNESDHGDVEPDDSSKAAPLGDAEKPLLKRRKRVPLCSMPLSGPGPNDGPAEPRGLADPCLVLARLLHLIQTEERAATRALPPTFKDYVSSHGTQRLISDVVAAVIEGLSNGAIEMAMLVREYLISRDFEADIVSAELYQSLRSEVLNLLALDEPATKEGLLAIGSDADNRQGVYANVITTMDDSFGFYIGGAAAIPAGRKKVAGLKARIASHKQQQKSKPSRHYNFWRGEGKSHKFVILALFDVEVPQGLTYFVEAICTILFGTWNHMSFRSLRPGTLAPLSSVAMPNDASPLCPHPSHLAAAEELIQLTADEYTAKLVEGCPVQREDTVRQLLSRERQPHQENDETLTEAFEQFARQEVALSGQKVEHLVRPSGRLTSPLAILLHWPTLSASRPDNGEVSDPTNGCLVRVLTKLDSATDVLMADYYCRRANKVPKSKISDSAVPMDAWSSESRAMHEGFTEWIIRSSQAKDWLVLGKANQERIQLRRGLKPLRILINGITIHGALREKR
ncbi:MAG: hypothetical protein M1819_001682 [Sarea resinae]|nr:MAG: hypothetical protein M1819_001682 [Sarea resinae]